VKQVAAMRPPARVMALGKAPLHLGGHGNKPYKSRMFAWNVFGKMMRGKMMKSWNRASFSGVLIFSSMILPIMILPDF